MFDVKFIELVDGKINTGDDGRIVVVIAVVDDGIVAAVIFDDVDDDDDVGSSDGFVIYGGAVKVGTTAG